MNKINRLYK